MLMKKKLIMKMAKVMILKKKLKKIFFKFKSEKLNKIVKMKKITINKWQHHRSFKIIIHGINLC